MHLDVARADPGAIVIELHVRVFGEERHRHRCVHDALGNHERRQPLAKRIVVVPGVPDRHLLGLPRFDGPHAQGLRGHQGDVAAAGGAGACAAGHAGPY